MKQIRKMKNKAGFTLVELMVVAIIVAILAAVAIPLMSSNKKRAAATECQAALGTARAALRAMFAETGVYDKDLNGDTIAAVADIPGIETTDLDGRYFIYTDYSIVVAASTYTITATGRATIPEAKDVVITLNQAGTFTYAGL
ncbi:MAG: prepilin-type N-terminal cleavage/methylation domain-containing protein [Verrucomicrobia bacterium]|nr:prepilin-type N-terminal cleavage/methylation domain-containing protein [Verrucomicrobiota bacterium]MDA1085654.1 prepilin-type N-terminal cleavage/methylation domain-containing protein [Verrucomicrobiota bacterium]